MPRPASGALLSVVLTAAAGARAACTAACGGLGKEECLACPRQCHWAESASRGDVRCEEKPLECQVCNSVGVVDCEAYCGEYCLVIDGLCTPYSQSTSKEGSSVWMYFVIGGGVLMGLGIVAAAVFVFTGARAKKVTNLTDIPGPSPTNAAVRNLPPPPEGTEMSHTAVDVLVEPELLNINIGSPPADAKAPVTLLP
eukprot:TRINITY_DN313_c3_g1_i7.p1 TRINITY_DN313_c3_g1~~TRINITY_DN313_c3_g1_i7.p1  ORF type:complete len:197 (+),score=53.20 TRINITY_DN313_c3_g1_i7:116-706(+)